MKFSLSSSPNQHSTQLVNFTRLDGGLNLWELDYRVAANQSPEMKNLWWQDGVLQCRDGQEYVSAEKLGTGYACYDALFWDHAFFHIGAKLYYADFSTEPEQGEERELVELVSGVPENRGTFFCYDECLFYKNRGGFVKIEYDPENTSVFTARNVVDDAYTPVILLNGDYSTGSGDEYQPENRLSAKKTVKYNAAETAKTVVKSSDGTTLTFSLGLTKKDDFLTGVSAVYFDTTLVDASMYTVDVDTGKVTLLGVPEPGTAIGFVARIGVTTYKLPISLHDEEDVEENFTGDGSWKEQTIEPAEDLKSVTKITVSGETLGIAKYSVDYTTGKIAFTDAPAADVPVVVHYKKYKAEGAGFVDKVVVDGAELAEGTDYAVNTRKGQIVFVTPPPVHMPALNNTIEVTYSKENPDALKAIMDCRYAEVYGGDQGVCIVMGGSEKQPNAFFWNSNDSVAMNSAYWPMLYYQLAGDAEDRVTGFGKQYGNLYVFKERSVGKADYGVEVLSERDTISLTYTSVNSKIGCDLPWSIQLIDNNLVFCNTRSGVHLIRESSSALENTVECISLNVNGTESRPGLLNDVQIADPEQVCSFDDDQRYWLCANGHVYSWDYQLSSWKNPSWFYFTNIYGVAYLHTVKRSYHLNAAGQLTQFARVFMDYGEAIEKLYQFPPQFFDTYDRLKDILYCIFTVRSDTDTVVDILYQSDYEERHDLTTIASFSYRLVPRNLERRYMRVQRYAHVAKRKPGCRHVRHFAMRLSNNKAAQDLAIISAQIYFRYLGRDR